jgi:hypothetical protein
MLYTFGYSGKKMAAACLFSALVAAGISARTNPSAADFAPAFGVSVNRAAKSDRLRPSPRPQQHMDNSGATDTMRSREPKSLGCEPAFSPIADPARADVMKRCLV